MIALPSFELATPKTVAEAVALLAEGGASAQVVAGGTDLLVNVRHRLVAPRLLVSLGGIASLRGVGVEDGALVVGAAEPLAAVASHPLVREHALALAQAAAHVAHPQARNVGTLGGNVCLDVRCRYVDRSEHWREALGRCLKSGGSKCHVVEGGRHCVAAMCGDTVAALVALDAEAEVVGPKGARRTPVEALRGKDGVAPLTLGPAELVTAVRIPLPTAGRVSAYRKWAVRQAVDFPLVSVGLVLERDSAGHIGRLQIAVGALGPRPKRAGGLERFHGERLTPPLAGAIAEDVRRQCVPLPNVLYDPAYRRRMIGVLVRRQLEVWSEAG